MHGQARCCCACGSGPICACLPAYCFVLQYASECWQVPGAEDSPLPSEFMRAAPADAGLVVAAGQQVHARLTAIFDHVTSQLAAPGLSGPHIC